MNSESTIAKRITIAYVGGLMLIALLSGAVHSILDGVINQQRDAATVINIAGRQRVLSQRIALLASELKAGDATAREPLAQAAALMLRSQDALVHGGDLGIRHGLSPAARKFYFAGSVPLDPAVRAFVANANDFAISPPTIRPTLPTAALSSMRTLGCCPLSMRPCQCLRAKPTSASTGC